MRTPLTSLRTNIELLGRGDQLAPLGARRGGRRAATSRSAELSDLVGELVDLATDSWKDEPAEPVRARRPGRRRLRHAPDPPHRARHHRATSTRTRHRSSVSPQQLERAISNLVDNAVKYSPAGTADRDRGRPRPIGGRARPRPGHRTRGPAARVRPLLPLDDRHAPSPARASGSRSCSRSSSATTVGCGRRTDPTAAPRSASSLDGQRRPPGTVRSQAYHPGDAAIHVHARGDRR